MSAASVQRQVALAGIALLAAIVALALTSHGSSQPITGLPQPVPVAGGGWYSALAGAERPRYGRRTRCGYLLEPGTEGVVDSVLPCGILVYVSYRDGPRILTRVIDRRPVLPGRKFDLTPKLAEELGIDGVQRIRWVFAR
ncbi:MAG: rare lipoprotein [Gaiellaceae bacterium]|nr:rare lipoprotein [Gaiellaceae bacterium]